MNRRWIGAAAAVTVLMMATPSFAQDPDFPTKEGAERFAEGNKLYTAKNYEGARLKFLQALAISRSKGVTFNLARSEEQVGKYADAYGHYQDYLKFPDAPAKGRADAEKYSAELAKKIGRIQIAAPAGAHVQLDGKDVGAAPFPAPLPVEPGSHEATFGAESKKVECAAGAVVSVTFEKKADPVAPPVVPVPVPPKPETPPITPPPQETKEKGSWLVPAVLAGVGVVGLGVGIGTGLASSSAATDGTAAFRGGACADLTSAACKSAQDQESSASTLKTASIVSYVVGGGFLVASVVSAAIITPWKVETKTASVWVSPGVGSLSLGGTF